MIQCRNGERHAHTTANEARGCWAATALAPIGVRIDFFPAAPAPADPAPVTTSWASAPAANGVYRHQDKIYRVITRPNGHRRAELLTGGAYVYAAGLVYKLRGAHRLTQQEAAEYGRAEGRCIQCATQLTDPRSIERGIGPVCATKI